MGGWLTHSLTHQFGSISPSICSVLGTAVPVVGNTAVNKRDETLLSVELTAQQGRRTEPIDQ